MNRRLYVGNLSFKTSEEDLNRHFSAVGAPESVAVVKDRASGKSRGFGFVEMKSEADAERAIRELDGKDLQGRPLKVNEAKARDNN
jgi:RNA recognition motif-containing protein